MCGICGVVGNLTEKEIYDRVISMEQTLVRRGPDGHGEIWEHGVGIGMRRLSIIDVKGGDQPLFNEDKSVELMLNGEIYNYIELMTQLRRKGHKFRTRSDCETVAHLYEDMGVKLVEKIRGMFAIALWDKKGGRLLLVRDRMGEKPIYYTLVDNNLYFASELKVLIKELKRVPIINNSAIDLFFHYYFIPEPNTPFENIYKLPPAHYLTYDVSSRKLEVNRYWDPFENPEPITNPVNTIRAGFERACELTLRSDVPVGISLSGGIDSGSILSVSAPKYDGKLRAFTVGYAGSPKSDERKEAKELADTFKIPIHADEIHKDEFIHDFPDLAYWSDDPIADIAAYSQFRVWRLAHEHKIKVILGGLGGDELFWGYPWTIKAAKLTEKKRDLLANPLVSAISNIFQPTKGNRIFNHRFPLMSVLITPEEQIVFYDQITPFRNGSSFISKFYTNEFKDSFLDDNPFKPLMVKPPWENVELMLREKISKMWLISNCVALGDRLSMANSVELRSPFLDYRLIESVVGMSMKGNSYKLGPKYWLKKAMEGIVPDSVLKRPKKGFTPPVGEWTQALIKTYQTIIKGGFLAENKILNTSRLSFTMKVSETIPQYWYALYQIILLEIWGRTLVWGESPEAIRRKVHR